ncbi:MAG: PIG-L deacetylase family protein, partial [Thermoplasmata archaeon]
TTAEQGLSFPTLRGRARSKREADEGTGSIAAGVADPTGGPRAPAVEARRRKGRTRARGSAADGEVGSLTVLAVSPHPDDVEIGCFGTLARLASEEPVIIVVLTSGSVRGPPDEREREAEESARLIGASIEFLHYPDGSLQQNAETVGRVRGLMHRHLARLVFAPYSDDTHQDHAAAYGIVVASAAHTGEILLYETPSTFGFLPDVYYDISATLSVKQRALALFQSQADRPYLDPALVDAQARYAALRLHERGKAFEAFALFRSVR